MSQGEAMWGVRGGRAWASRLCRRPAVRTRQVTVIAGPHGAEPCVCFTAYGGPRAPREPWDAPDAEREASLAFWAEHALAV